MEGGCYCKAIRYRVTGKPILKAQCHCRECQYITGGAPNLFLTVPSEGFEFVAGAPRAFTRSDIDNPRTREFCPDCGTHLVTRINERGLTVVKIGTLDTPAEDYGGPKAAIFMKDTQPYHLVARDVPVFDALPPIK